MKFRRGQMLTTDESGFSDWLVDIVDDGKFGERVTLKQLSFGSLLIDKALVSVQIMVDKEGQQYVMAGGGL